MTPSGVARGGAPGAREAEDSPHAGSVGMTRTYPGVMFRRHRDPGSGRTAARVLVPTAALGAGALVAAIAVPLSASAAVDLPDLSPQELLELVADADAAALTGTIEQTSDLGLPDLGALTGDADAADLLTGTHTARVYIDGDRSRVQVLDRLAERNLYVDAADREAWWVDSETATATRFTVGAEGSSAEPGASKTPSTPSDLIDRALTALDESTRVSVGDDARVAGRAVYELVLEPRSADTLVGELRFTVDAETGIPLAAEVTAQGASEPAFSTRFTEISFDAPAPDTVEFVPGPGVTVEDETITRPERDSVPDRPEPTVIGEGWESVVQLPVGETIGQDGDPEVLEQATRAVNGGRVLETALLTVLLTDDGRVLVGAVPAERLVEAAAG